MRQYPRFETRRLSLRPFKFADAPAIRKMVSEPEVLESLPDLPDPYSVADAEDWIATHPFLFAETGEIHMALCLKSIADATEEWDHDPAGTTENHRTKEVESPLKKAPKPEGFPPKTLIGAMGLCSREAGRGEIGFWLGKAYQGKGYTREALVPVLQYGFRSLKLQTVFAEVRESNTASRRVLEKAGFRADPHMPPGQPEKCLLVRRLPVW